MTGKKHRAAPGRGGGKQEKGDGRSRKGRPAGCRGRGGEGDRGGGVRVSHSREGDPRCRSERLGRGEGCQRACGMSRPERRLDSSTRRRGLPAPVPSPAPALRRGGRCRSRRRCRSRCARDPAPLADGKVSLSSLGSEGAKPEPCSWRRRDLESARKGGRRRAEGGSEGEEKKGRRSILRSRPRPRGSARNLGRNKAPMTSSLSLSLPLSHSPS